MEVILVMQSSNKRFTDLFRFCRIFSDSLLIERFLNTFVQCTESSALIISTQRWHYLDTTSECDVNTYSILIGSEFNTCFSLETTEK